MATWSEFSESAPDLAAKVTEAFRAHRHHTMATVRRDGAPRISGTEVELTDGELRIGMMPGTVRAADLRRDARIAIHAQPVDPPPDDDAGWVGEAKVAGRAEPIPMSLDLPGDAFAIDLTDVVFTSIGSPPDHLVIERWTPTDGVTRIERR